MKLKFVFFVCIFLISCNPFGIRKKINKTYQFSSPASIGVIFKNVSAIGGNDLLLSDSLLKENVFYELSSKLNNRNTKLFLVKDYESSYEDYIIREKADLFLICELRVFRSWNLSFPNRYVTVLRTKLMDGNYIKICTTKFNTLPSKIYNFRNPPMKISIKVSTQEALKPVIKYINQKS